MLIFRKKKLHWIQISPHSLYFTPYFPHGNTTATTTLHHFTICLFCFSKQTTLYRMTRGPLTLSPDDNWSCKWTNWRDRGTPKRKQCYKALGELTDTHNHYLLRGLYISSWLEFQPVPGSVCTSSPLHRLTQVNTLTPISFFHFCWHVTSQAQKKKFQAELVCFSALY